MPRLVFFQIGVFISAFLIFSGQLIMARELLPLFGGGVMVWGTCMIFFQGLLLAGYGFAHWGLSRFGVKGYTKLHWGLMIAGLICYPLQRNTPVVADLSPTVSLLVLLGIKAAMCFFALSTISLVVQRWLSASSLKEKSNPYILYSPSNLGSILGLLSYPFLVERFLELDVQSYFWWCGYLLLMVVLILCTPRNVEGEVEEDSVIEDDEKSNPLRWLALSACGSALLLSTTNIITFDIASTPLLWVLPLTIYLLTFVLVFKSKGWFPNWLSTAAFWILPVGLVICWFSELHIVLFSLPLMVLLYLGFLFVLCMCCHGTLHRERPKDPRQLTRFYLYMSLGGFTGSVIINWVIPFLSDRSIEYPLTLFLTAWLLSRPAAFASSRKPVYVHAGIYLVTVLALFFVVGRIKLEPQFTFLVIGLSIMLPLIIAKQSALHFRYFFGCAIVALISSPYLISNSTNIFFHRNFYGIYKVFDQDGKRHLMHGTTRHGTQYLEDSEHHFLPLAYYHPTTPSGGLLNDNPMGVQKIGMIGLGSGALGAYLSEGQHMTVYEIDPDNVDIAETHFSFLEYGRQNGAEIDYVIGDGRLALNDVEDDAYDLFVVDAFSSDSIPVHLITIEAFQTYLRVINSEGILILHCSNRHLDVLGLIQANAEVMGLNFLHKDNAGLDNGDSFPSDWVALSKSEAMLERLQQELGWKPYQSKDSLPSPWTDQFSSIIDMLK